MNISRRGFGKILAAFTMVPTIELRKQIDQEKLLAAFCDQDLYKVHYDLEKPFGFGSLTYATDARHMVRTELAGRIENGERRLPRNVGEVWEKFFAFDGYRLRPFQLPPIQSCIVGPNDLTDPSTCPMCDGRRISLGDEYLTEEQLEEIQAYKRGYDVDDNSVYDDSCELCKGRTYYGPTCLRIDGVLFNYSRLKPIAALPNVRVVKSREPGCIAFVADGFEGVAVGLVE